jgi:DNA helicase-2/ATP-dependent DNA helicase PcrA
MPEIAALIDPRQFELITAPDAGLVVVHGGAGSGKTTIGLHRMAYLAYLAPKRFTPDRMLVVTYGVALASYISQVLPALGVAGVEVVTFGAWAARERRRAMPWLDLPVADDTPSVVTRLKKHPVLLHELTRRAVEVTSRPGTRRDTRAVVELWADALTDLPALLEAFARSPEADTMHPAEIRRAHRWCSERCPAVLDRDSARADGGSVAT